MEWRPDVTSGRCWVQNNSQRSERPERLMHRTLRTHLIIFADITLPLLALIALGRSLNHI